MVTSAAVVAPGPAVVAVPASGAAARLGPRAHHERLDVSLVLTAHDAEEAVLSPLFAPGVGHDLGRQHRSASSP